MSTQAGAWRYMIGDTIKFTDLEKYEMDTEINEFVVAALPDEQLMELNKNYRVARDKALSGIKVKTVATEQLCDWLEQTKNKGGQVKMPEVMPVEKMHELLHTDPLSHTGILQLQFRAKSAIK